MLDRLARYEIRHRQQQEWNGQDHAELEPPGHLNELGTDFLSTERDHRFERHTANRARAGHIAQYLWMHGASVLSLWPGMPRQCRFQPHTTLRTGTARGRSHLRMHGTGVWLTRCLFANRLCAPELH